LIGTGACLLQLTGYSDEDASNVYTVYQYLNHNVRDVEDGANDGIDAASDDHEAFTGVGQSVTSNLY